MTLIAESAIMPDMASGFVGTSEAAKRCGVDRSTFFRWMQLNEIQPIDKLPGSTGALLFDADDVAALAEKKALILKHDACPLCSDDRAVYWHNSDKCPLAVPDRRAS